MNNLFARLAGGLQMRESLKVSLRPGQTTISFAASLAAVNGSLSLSMFLKHLAIDSRKLDQEAVLQHLSNVCGVEVSELKFSHPTGGDHKHVYGQKLPSKALRADRSRVCISCLMEDRSDLAVPELARPFARAAWLSTQIRSCPIHDEALIDLNGKVPKEVLNDLPSVIRYFSNSLLGEDGAATRLVHSEFDQYFSNRLNGKKCNDHPFLDSLPFYAATTLTEIIGVQILFGSSMARKKLNEFQMSDAARAGFEVTSTGKEATEDFLSISSRRFFESKRMLSTSELYGRVYEWLRNSGESDLDSLRNLIVEHAYNNLPLGERDHVLGQSRPRRLHSVATASSEARFNPARLSRILVAKNFLNETSINMQPIHVLLDAATATPVLQELADCLSPAKASKSFKISRTLLREMEDASLVTSYLKGNYRYGIPDLYRSKDVEHILFKLREQARASYDPTRHLGISEAASRTEFSEIQVVKLILESKLHLVALSPFDLAFECVQVDPSEFSETWVAPPFVDFVVVARWFFTTLPNIEALATTHYFNSDTSLGIQKNGLKIISVRELKDFSAKFEAISKIARDRSKSVRGLREHFKSLGIKPAFTLPTGLSFYYKSDL